MPKRVEHRRIWKPCRTRMIRSRTLSLPLRQLLRPCQSATSLAHDTLVIQQGQQPPLQSQESCQHMALGAEASTSLMLEPQSPTLLTLPPQIQGAIVSQDGLRLSTQFTPVIILGERQLRCTIVMDIEYALHLLTQVLSTVQCAAAGHNRSSY